MQAVTRSVKLGRLKEEERITTLKNPKIEKALLGEKPDLDEGTGFVLELYWELRRATTPEAGILLPLKMDPVLRRLLKSCDAAYFNQRAEALREKKND